MSLVELAEDWLMAKELASRSTSVNSTLARRRDLCRWGRAIRTGLGRPVDDTERLSIEGDLAGVRLSDLTADNCLQALAVLRGSGKASSTARALSTWRGFCHWLTRRGYLKVDPTDDDLLTAPAVIERLPRAFTGGEIDQLRSAAGDPPVSATGAWPTRDAMILELLAGSGCRVSELCALQIGDVDRRHEHPILRLRHTKNGSERDVPLPTHVVVVVDEHLAERAKAGPRQPLLVRVGGESMTRQDVDHILRRLCRAAGVTAPAGEMAHGFRHFYGTTMAVRAVPLPVIQQLLGHSDPRTSSIYTRVAATSLTNALHDAGML